MNAKKSSHERHRGPWHAAEHSEQMEPMVLQTRLQARIRSIYADATSMSGESANGVEPRADRARWPSSWQGTIRHSFRMDARSARVTTLLPSAGRSIILSTGSSCAPFAPESLCLSTQPSWPGHGSHGDSGAHCHQLGYFIHWILYPFEAHKFPTDMSSLGDIYTVYRVYLKLDFYRPPGPS